MALSQSGAAAPILFFMPGPGVDFSPFLHFWESWSGFARLAAWDQPYVPQGLNLSLLAASAASQVTALAKNGPVVAVGISAGGVTGLTLANKGVPGLSGYIGAGQVVSGGALNLDAAAATPTADEMAGFAQFKPSRALDYDPRVRAGRAFAALAPAIHGFEATKLEPHFAVPMLFLQGEQDGVCPGSALSAFLNRVTSTWKRIDINGAGHHPLMLRDTAGAAIREWLAGLGGHGGRDRD